MRWDVGIDIGTSKVRLAELRRGPALEESAALVFHSGSDTPICGGDEAENMRGRIGDAFQLRYPLRAGIPESNLMLERMYHRLFRKMETVNHKRHFNLLSTCVPFARPVQMEALRTTALDAGAASVALVRSDAVSAIGADVDILSPEAKLVVDLGAGKITATLFTFGHIAAFDHLPYGMERIDDRIVQQVREDYGYRIGHASAVQIKHTLGSALPATAPKEIMMHTTGFSLVDCLPRHFEVETPPVLNACEEVVHEVVSLCLHVVNHAPEGLSADLNDTGVVLVGGGADLPGLDKRIGDALGIPCRVADAPSTCAIRGLFSVMREPERYRCAFLNEQSAEFRR